jgi:hypothetical protein
MPAIKALKQLRLNFFIKKYLRLDTTKCIVMPSSTLYDTKVSGSFSIFPKNNYIFLNLPLKINFMSEASRLSLFPISYFNCKTVQFD